MAKAPKATPASVPETDPLAEAVDRLTAELRLFRNVMDEIREDFSWVTRNGLPVRPVEHLVVKQMALDPCAEDWGKRLVVERHTGESRSPLESPCVYHVASDLQSTLDSFAPRQLESVLVALDGVREQLLAALKMPKCEDELTIVNSQAACTQASALERSSEKPPRGCLF